MTVATGTDCRALFHPSGSDRSGRLPVLLRQPYRPVWPPPPNLTWVPRQPLTVPGWLRPPAGWAPPGWALTPPVPHEHARQAWRKVKDGQHDSADRALAGVALLAGWYALTARPWIPPTITALLWATAVGYGAGVLWLCHHEQAPWRWTARRATFTLTLLVVLGILTLTTGALLPLTVLSVLAAQAFAYRPGSPEDRAQWWSHTRLQTALTASGVLPADATLRYRGRPLTDEHGTAVTVALPPGVTWEKVQTRRVHLASALDVPERQLAVTHDPEQPANAVTLWVGSGLARGVTRSPIADLPVTCWRDPVRIGLDARGTPVTVQTDEHNTLIGGRPGFGKTTAVRLILGHYLLDPTTTIYGLDGKASQVDYGPLVPLTAQWVWGTDPDPADDLLTMLRRVLDVVRTRNGQPAPAAGWPAVLLLLEELQDVRAATTVEQRDELDVTLGRIVRMGRAVAVQVVISTQRPVKDDVPTGVSRLVSQGLCLSVKQTEEARVVLGETPTLPLPARRGEAILGTAAEQRLLQVDLLDHDAWRALCARAALARRDAPHPPEALALPAVEDAVAAAVKVDPLTEAVRSLLEVGPTRASVLLDLLPDELRPANATALGKALAAMPGLGRTRIGKDSGWQLHPSQHPSRPTAGPHGAPPAEGPRTGLHAQSTPDSRDVTDVPALTGDLP